MKINTVLELSLLELVCFSFCWLSVAVVLSYGLFVPTLWLAIVDSGETHPHLLPDLILAVPLLASSGWLAWLLVKLVVVQILSRGTNLSSWQANSQCWTNRFC